MQQPQKRKQIERADCFKVRTELLESKWQTQSRGNLIPKYPYSVLSQSLYIKAIPQTCFNVNFTSNIFVEEPLILFWKIFLNENTAVQMFFSIKSSPQNLRWLVVLSVNLAVGWLIWKFTTMCQPGVPPGSVRGALKKLTMTSPSTKEIVSQNVDG